MRRLALRLKRDHYFASGGQGLVDSSAPPVRNALGMWQGAPAVAGEEEEKVERLREQLMRLQAEFDNFRKRQRRDEQQRTEMANQKLIEQLLPVIDNFDRALATPGSSVEALASGIQMVRQQLVDSLAKMGLEKTEALGQTFDPNLHEAVSMAPAGDYPENQIVEVFQDGYTLHGRLLRPAMVRVAKG